MTKPLTVEQRKRIAEECTGLMYSIHEDEEFGEMVLRGKIYPDFAETDLMDEWDPDGDDFKALVSRVAQEIYSNPAFAANRKRAGFWSRLGVAIATNNTPAIELLAWELLEGKE